MEPVAIVGSMVNLQPGESITCKGSWKTVPKHGLQFNVQTYERKAPATLLGITKYLSSGLIKGIGPVFAKKIVKVFGLETLNILNQHPEKLFFY